MGSIHRGVATAACAATIGCCGLLASAPNASATALPPIHHVWVIELENKGYAAALGDSYLGKTLPALGKVLTNYYATGHESLDNYVSEASGQAPNALTQADCPRYIDVTPGVAIPGGQVAGAGCVYPAATQSIADQLSAAGLTWHGYMEDMGNDPARDHTGPGGVCGHPVLNSTDGTESATATDQYATRHDPFMYFHSIIDDAAKCANVVPLTRLAADLGSVATTPDFSFITPNLCNDGHDATCAGPNLAGNHQGGLVAADLFLQHWVPLIMASPAYRADGALVVTWDEAETSDATSCCGEAPGPGSPLPGITGPGGGHVAAIVISKFTQPGTTSAVPYNHYSLLRTEEGIFGVSPLAAAAGVTPFGSDVWDAAATAPGTTGTPGSPGGTSGSPGGASGSPGTPLPTTGAAELYGADVGLLLLAAGAVLLSASGRVRVSAPGSHRGDRRRAGGPPGTVS